MFIFFKLDTRLHILVWCFPFFSPTDGTIHICNQSNKIRKGDGLQLLGVKMLVPIVNYALMLARSANGSYSPIDKPKQLFNTPPFHDTASAYI